MTSKLRVKTAAIDMKAVRREIASAHEEIRNWEESLTELNTTRPLEQAGGTRRTLP